MGMIKNKITSIFCPFTSSISSRQRKIIDWIAKQNSGFDLAEFIQSNCKDIVSLETSRCSKATVISDNEPFNDFIYIHNLTYNKEIKDDFLLAITEFTSLIDKLKEDALIYVYPYKSKYNFVYKARCGYKRELIKKINPLIHTYGNSIFIPNIEKVNKYVHNKYIPEDLKNQNLSRMITIISLIITSILALLNLITTLCKK